MKRAIALLPVVFIAAVIEIILAGVFGGSDTDYFARPDIVLAIVCLVAVNLPLKSAVLCGLLAGVVLDLFSGGAFGTYAAAYTAAASVSGSVRRSVAHDAVISQILLVLILACFVESFCIVRLSLLSRSFDVFAAVQTSLFSVLLSGLAAPIIFQMKEIFFERFGFLPSSSSFVSDAGSA
ncbi:MAG: rod shape-determining protein MreD [Planctomycetota bacterium]|jgi:rod shape-determining protein MreD